MLISAADVVAPLPFAVGVTTGPEHLVEVLNPAARLLLGTDAPLGRPVGELVPDPGRRDLVDCVERAFHGVGSDASVQAVAGDGPGARWVDVHCSPLHDPSGDVQGVLVQVTEVPAADASGPGTPGRAGRERARGAALQRLAAELSRAATPAAIGRLAVTTAARLLGADAASAFAAPDRGTGSAPDSIEMVHSTGWARQLIEPYHRLPLHRGRPLSDAVLTGTPVWLEDAEQWRARYPEMAPVHSAGGYQASACLPLRVEERDLGAVVFSFLEPRAFSADERDYLLAVAALCAQALDRARLYAAEQTARTAAELERDRMTFLAEANQLLEAPLSVEERLQRLADLAVPGVADWCAVHLVRTDRVDQVAVGHTDPEKKAFVARLQQRYPPNPQAPSGAIRVARTGLSSLVGEITDDLLVAAAVDDTHLQLLRTIGMRSALVVPLLVRGTSLGALTLVHAESGRRFDEADLAFAEQLARGAALALDNARLFEQQRGVAHTLQSALLPIDLPSAPGLRLAARYHPQSANLDETYVGGDVYDVVEGGEPDRWSVMVGDVCGKGPEAAALTALIRHTLRAEVSHRLGPAEVLRRVNAAMLRQSGAGALRFATVAHGRLAVDPDGVTMCLASAGHLPPLVLRHERVEAVVVTGTLLGVYQEVELPEVEVRLERGDALVLYTDGITEARGAAGFYGTDRLSAVLGSCTGRSADEIADAVLADVLAFRPGPLDDDVALLVVQAAP